MCCLMLVWMNVGHTSLFLISNPFIPDNNNNTRVVIIIPVEQKGVRNGRRECIHIFRGSKWSQTISCPKNTLASKMTSKMMPSSSWHYSLLKREALLLYMLTLASNKMPWINFALMMLIKSSELKARESIKKSVLFIVVFEHTRQQ